MNRILLSASALSLVASPALAGHAAAGHDAAGHHPNILWISAEDISADLGAYGDEYATTPTLDAFAAEGATYTRCFANAGVCAVARSCIITGMYPVAIGSQHMRSDVVPPPEVKCFPEYLRAAGYYTTNRSKTDYNFNAPPSAWDENGTKHKDWAGRAKGQPFFSVINLTISHESKVRDPAMRKRMDELLGDDRHDSAKVKLPPYIPDTPEARADRAQYYDVLTLLDRQVKEILDRLAKDGLADDTIVMFWGDHGVGLPRAKRWVYDSGMHVPMMIRWPGTIRPGTRNEELVSFVDFAPTTLNLAGVGIPDHMQGRAFLGDDLTKPRDYVYAHRDRMDETYDLIRAVRDKRYKYIRNFYPERSRGQNLTYMDIGGTMQSMRRLNAENKLTGPERRYFLSTKPVEELYDTKADPHEIFNVAADPAHEEILERLRKRLEDWQVETGDLGMLPEPVVIEEMRPEGKKARTAAPQFRMESQDEDRVSVTLTCETPGASIVYGIGDEPATTRLYVQPFSVDVGAEVKALACRLGFQDSKVSEGGTRKE
ncbi:sulfatase-like hydrolase/transferase [Alienimonas chondri]|uniref:Sulfatase n=1 Tax=Alienimonas chondri TaxID=2681879 RepID=A0ABX1VGT9_9PLAN|nr:sulfatase-like hydrolase/transferase [Alienimonas chondri]NNJ27314.1 hypothetical protein [Alienimonas chondri]